MFIAKNLQYVFEEREIQRRINVKQFPRVLCSCSTACTCACKGGERVGRCLGSMGSLLSALSSWRPTLGAGTYTVLGDTNGLFERYLTEPGTSSSSVAVPSLAELPSLIVAQLLPESAAASSRGSAVTRVWPRVSPQLPSRRQQECNLTLHFSPYQCLIGSLRVEQGGLPHRAVEVHGGVLFGGRHHFCEDFQV